MIENNKVYIAKENTITSMLPGDPQGSPDESFSQKDKFEIKKTLIFVDEAFLNKLSKHLGNGRYIRFDKIKLCNIIAKKENLECQKILYYTAPPFQSPNPTKEEELKKEGYDKFVNKLREKGVIVREGRCQRIKVDNKFEYHQKGVDIILTMDLVSVNIEYPNIKSIILISTDSDFVPVIEKLKELGIKIILYTYYERKRDTNFSRSNELIKKASKYVILNKYMFEQAKFT